MPIDEHKKYYAEINIMRGLLALLVVAGHITTQIEQNGTLEAAAICKVGWVIYSFHMALFFMISGFVSVRSMEMKSVSERITYTKKRCLRLLLPYFAMGLVYLPFRILLGSMARTSYEVSNFWRILIGENPNGTLWFLYVLFVISIVGCWCVRRKTLVPAVIITGVLAVITNYVVLPDVIGNLFFYSFFYFVGALIRQHYDRFSRFVLNAKCGCVFLALFAACNFLRNGPALPYTPVLGILYRCALFVAAFSGCFLIWWICAAVSGHARSAAFRGFCLLGDYSMDIYIFAEPVKVVARTIFGSLPLTVMAILTFVVSVSAAIVGSKYIVRKSKILKGLFLGG